MPDTTPGTASSRRTKRIEPQPGPAAGASASVPSRDVGRNLRWAIRLLYAETVATGVVTLLTLWLAIASDSIGVASAVATVAFAALCAAILGGLAAALARGKGLARGPAILVHMLLIPIGGYMIAGGIAWLGVPVLLVGLLGAGLLLAPSTRTALGLDR